MVPCQDFEVGHDAHTNAFGRKASNEIGDDTVAIQKGNENRGVEQMAHYGQRRPGVSCTRDSIISSMNASVSKPFRMPPLARIRSTAASARSGS